MITRNLTSHATRLRYINALIYIRLHQEFFNLHSPQRYDKRDHDVAQNRLQRRRRSRPAACEHDENAVQRVEEPSQEHLRMREVALSFAEEMWSKYANEKQSRSNDDRKKYNEPK